MLIMIIFLQKLQSRTQYLSASKNSHNIVREHDTTLEEIRALERKEANLQAQVKILEEMIARDTT